MTEYTAGQVALIRGTFLDPTTKAGLSATAIKLRILDPGKTETVVLTGFGSPSVGVYTATVEVLTPGTWQYRWEVSAPFEAACEGRFFVKTSAFSNPL